MTAILGGKTSQGNLIFGSGFKPKPLKGWPPGKVRIRQRNADFVQAFVRTENSIRHFYVAEKDGFWFPGHEQGSNLKSKCQS